MIDKGKFIMGVDIGFTATGISLFKINEQGAVKYHSSTVITTEKSNKKKQIRVADDDIQRIIHIVQEFTSFVVDNIGIDFRRNMIAFAESPTGGALSAKAQKAMGMAVAMSATMFELMGIPVEYVTPREVKVAVTGNPTASKDEIMNKVIKMIKGSTSIERVNLKSGKVRQDTKYHTPDGTKYGQNFEHIADSIGAVLHSKRKSQMYKMFTTAGVSGKD